MDRRGRAVGRASVSDWVATQDDDAVSGRSTPRVGSTCQPPPTAQLLWQPVSSRLVGRAVELSAVFDAQRRLTDGVGRFLCVEGQAGIGKTSLLAAAADILRSDGTTVASASAVETDRHRPLVLARRLLPGLPGPRPHADPIDAALAAVERCAGEGRLVLVADDVHWADDASLEVFRAIGSRAQALGLVLIVATRSQAAPAGLRRLVELADEREVCLRLGPLGTDDLVTLVEQQLGAPPGARLSSTLATTAGNPFLAAELVRSLVEDGQILVGGDVAEIAASVQIPGGLSRRLATRTLGAVPGGDVLLRAAAMVPGGVTADELAAMVDAPIGMVLTATLAAVDLGVIVDTGSALTFRHELIRRSVVEATPPSITRTLSRRAADVLRQRHADPERVTACLLAGTDPDDGGDVERLLSAGREYQRNHPGAAAELLDRALAALARSDPRRQGVLIEFGWALVAAGRASEVHARLADGFGEPDAAAPVEVHRLQGIAASLSGRLDLVVERYAHVEPGDLGERYDARDAESVDAVAELALLRVSTARLREAAAIVEWVERSPAPDSPFRASSIGTVKAWLAASAGRFEDGVVHARAALDWAQRDATRRASAVVPALALAACLDHLGDSDGALGSSRGRASELVLPRWGPPLLQFFAAVALYRRGDWDDALAEVDAGLRAADDADVNMAVFWPYAVGALVACARSEVSHARALLHEGTARSSAPSLGREWLAYAWVCVAEADGDVGGAVGVVEPAVVGIEAAGAPALFVNGGPDMARVCLQAGRADLADRIAQGIATLATRTSSPVVAAMRSWIDGLVRGDSALLEEAAESLLLSGRVPEAAQANRDAAVARARAGDLEASRGLAKEAFALFESLGAEQWRRQLRSDLRAAGLDIRPRRGPRRPHAGWTSLTASEQAIVALVGEGLTNTEIADRLFVSRRTVESHLGRVYTKLGLSSRAQLVADVIQRRQ
jgi:DNA-binding CsgD family transcriptional regulator